MTDMKISDGAVEAYRDAADDTSHAYLIYRVSDEQFYVLNDGPVPVAAPLEPVTISVEKHSFADERDALLFIRNRCRIGGITAALRYYAAHPDELPQEVVDAVVKMNAAPRLPKCPYCKDTKKMASIGGPPQPCWRCT